MAKKVNKTAANDIELMASSSLGTDLNAWLNQQGIESEQSTGQSQPTDEGMPEKVEIAPVSGEAIANNTLAPPKVIRQRERYEGQFFRRIEAFKKPTNMMYMSEKTYRLLTFLLRCSKENNTKITMPEILENIISQHIRDNDSVINQMHQEHLERQSKGF